MSFLETGLVWHDFTDKRLKLAEYIIGKLDYDGYIQARLGFHQRQSGIQLNMEVSEEEWQGYMTVIQVFDPQV
jgi:DNA-directed RNA polymerase specialized sigma54-like protein